MRLNRGLSCLLFLGVLAFSGCSDDKWEGLKVFDGTFFEIGSEGNSCEFRTEQFEWWLPGTGESGARYGRRVERKLIRWCWTWE
ncbi:MAG: hypothetical protein ACLU4J_17920 [Butyricimonas paravirosa]